MSVRERLEDAILLWKNDRREGAWIQVLIAAAATARQRFPTGGDGEVFRKFIREVTPTINDATKPPIPGGITVIFESKVAKPMSLDEAFYKHLRCYLLHEAVIPILSYPILYSPLFIRDASAGGRLRYPHGP